MELLTIGAVGNLLKFSTACHMIGLGGGIGRTGPGGRIAPSGRMASGEVARIGLTDNDE